MKTLHALLVFAACHAHGQVPGKPGPDSMPVARPDRRAVIPMPTNRPDNAFYRSPKDPSNVVRATLDNMPIHGYDTTAQRSPAIRRIRPRK